MNHFLLPVMHQTKPSAIIYHNEFVISYGGRALTTQEQNWSTPELECLALIESIKYYHSYVAHRPFTIFSDHKSLEFLMTKKKLTGKLLRWALYLQSFTFEVIHKSDKSNALADFLSRQTYSSPSNTNNDSNLSGPSCCNLDTDQDSIVTEFIYDSENITPTLSTIISDIELPNLPELATSQQSCEDFAAIYAYKQQGQLPDDVNLHKKIITTSEYFDICEGVLYHWIPRRTKDSVNEDRFIKRIALPTALRPAVLKAYHDKAGHLGIDRVTAK